jgi:hypothetical protein
MLGINTTKVALYFQKTWSIDILLTCKSTPLSIKANFTIKQIKKK